MKLLVLGDSHALVFGVIDELALLPCDIDVCSVPGATAMGMVNPKSRTDALRTFRRKIAGEPRSTVLVTQLGEVDCGFLIWWRAANERAPVERQLRVSLDNYMRFVSECEQQGFRVIVLSAPLPTLRDGDHGEVADLRRSISATQRERTLLTLRYNEKLGLWARLVGAEFVDVGRQELDETTGVIRADLLSDDPEDHHHDQWGYALLLAKALRHALPSGDSRYAAVDSSASSGTP